MQWTSEVEVRMKPEDPPMKGQGIESVRSLGGLWIVAEGKGGMPGGGGDTTLMTLGYDPEKRRFVTSSSLKATIIEFSRRSSWGRTANGTASWRRDP